ncbi:MAG: PepSY-like domain-containing protein [Muribaculaceae bacterium]|nr:PepSY-like domain-containing protein [Muribaculaceae bacterium]MDE5968895.1 PepSY-like domain-containing protein [Muribaculaceae bacterium]
MIKKIFLSFMAFIGVALVSSARDTYARDASALPQAAQTTLTNNFKSKVSIVKIEKTLGKVTEFEVIMTDGSEISFDKSGNWKSVEVGRGKAVPSGFVLKGMTDYVKKNHSGQKIVGIDKERGGYEVELSNGIDIKFDSQGNFVKYDD